MYENTVQHSMGLLIRTADDHATGGGLGVDLWGGSPG